MFSSHRERKRQTDRQVMNWITFNYVCVLHICICDVQCSSVTERGKGKERERGLMNWVTFNYASTPSVLQSQREGKEEKERGG